MISYQGTVYRPPSEADSLILQATLGCSWNRCTFCEMYRAKDFRVRPMSELKAEIAWAKEHMPWTRKVFLADGDALIARASFLGELCDRLRDAFPHLRQVSVYASPQSLQVRTIEEMADLHERGLRLYYIGIESGDDEVLAQLDKGVDGEQWVAAAAKATAAGVKLSAMILLGAGGQALSDRHARASAEIINRIQPRFLSTLVMTAQPGTPLWDQQQSGAWVQPDSRQLAAEMHTFLSGLDLRGTIFRSNHVSNRLVLAGTLPRDLPKLLEATRPD